MLSRWFSLYRNKFSVRQGRKDAKFKCFFSNSYKTFILLLISRCLHPKLFVQKYSKKQRVKCRWKWKCKQFLDSFLKQSFRFTLYFIDSKWSYIKGSFKKYVTQHIEIITSLSHVTIFHLLYWTLSPLVTPRKTEGWKWVEIWCEF